MTFTLSEFKNLVDEQLVDASYEDKLQKSLIAKNLFEILLESLSGTADFDDGLDYLKKEVVGLASTPVQQILEKVDLGNDQDVNLALVALELSQSTNKLSLDTIRRSFHGGDEKDIFYEPMRRFMSSAEKYLDLQGYINELGIEIPDDTDKEHWSTELLSKFSTVAELRSSKWPDVEKMITNSVNDSSKQVLMQDMKKLYNLWSSKAGPQKDAHLIPKIRQELENENVSLNLASQFEERGKTSLAEISFDDIDTLHLNGEDSQNMSRNELNETKNKLRSAKTRKEKESSSQMPNTKGQNIKDEEAYAILKQLEGGSDTVKGLDDVAKLAPLITKVFPQIGGPQLALAIGATKIFAEEMEKRQKEADAIMKENQVRAEKAKEEAVQLAKEISANYDNITEKSKEEVVELITALSEKVKLTESFEEIGKNFQDSKAILKSMEGEHLNLKTETNIIESYRSDEELVASVSGGLTLHGLSILLEDYPILQGPKQILKCPTHVQVFGPTTPFETSVFKATSESEMGSFSKTASSGGMTMALSITNQSGKSRSAKFLGTSVESSSSTSRARELAESKMNTEERTTETSQHIKKGFLTEFVKMPMRCVRIPYDGMRLSEEAKVAILKIDTEREAMSFLRTYGSHLPFSMHTLGGVFFRTVAMESEEEVTSVKMFSEAGQCMSHSTSTSSTSKKSGGYSGGLFGLGPKIGGSSMSSSAMKSGGSSFEADASTDAAKDKKINYSYSFFVSSLGPNATSAEDFYSSLSSSTGQWAVIDRGDLDEVIPVWDLIQDEMIKGEKVLGEEMEYTDEEKKIRKSVFLMKRVWARRAREWLESPSPPHLPQVILRQIQDFVIVSDSIGRIVNCICAVIIPSIDEVDTCFKQNRVAMLQSLQILVYHAYTSLSESNLDFDNYWIKAFVKRGMDTISDLKRKKQEHMTYNPENMIFPSFQAAPLLNDETEVTKETRQIHSEAAECARELNEEAWEQLCDEFVHIARFAVLPYFKSFRDEDRISTVWNVCGHRGTSNNAFIKTAIGTTKLQGEGKAEVHCPDSVTPVAVRIVPPLSYDDSWRWKEIIQANRIVKQVLYPGESYFFIRHEKNENGCELKSEDTILEQGSTIVYNEYPFDIDLDGTTEILSESVLVYRGKDENENSIPVKSNLDHCAYFLRFSKSDPLCKSVKSIQFLTKNKMKAFDRGYRGLLLISKSDHRRMHQWNRERFEARINAINESFNLFCLDQFWKLIPTKQPAEFGASFDPDNQCFLIKNMKSQLCLYARPSYVGGSHEFGFLPEPHIIHPSLIWQFVKVDDDKAYYIINTFSERRLCISRTINDNFNEVEACNVDEFESEDMSERCGWYLVPWLDISSSKKGVDISSDLFEEDLLKNLTDGSKKCVVLGRDTLAPKDVKKNGGVVLINNYPIRLKASWFFDGDATEIKIVGSNTFILEGNSDVSMIFPGKTDEAKVFPDEDGSKAKISIEYNNLDAQFEVERGKDYFIHFPESDPLCIDMPKVLPKENVNEELDKRKGYRLFDDELKYCLLGFRREQYEEIQRPLEIYGVDIKIGFHKDQKWDLVPTKNAGIFHIVQKFQDENDLCLTRKNDKAVSLTLKPTNESKFDRNTWIIKEAEDQPESLNEGQVACTIKSYSDEKYLSMSPKPNDNTVCLQSKAQTWIVAQETFVDTASIKSWVTPRDKFLSPLPPTDISTMKQSDSSIRIKWTPPIDPAAASYFISQIGPSGQVDHDNIVSNEYEIDRLRPGSTYMFEISSSNEFGRSPPNKITATTTDSIKQLINAHQMQINVLNTNMEIEVYRQKWNNYNDSDIFSCTHISGSFNADYHISRVAKPHKCYTFNWRAGPAGLGCTWKGNSQTNGRVDGDVIVYAKMKDVKKKEIDKLEFSKKQIEEHYQDMLANERKPES